MLQLEVHNYAIYHVFLYGARGALLSFVCDMSVPASAFMGLLPISHSMQLVAGIFTKGAEWLIMSWEGSTQRDGQDLVDDMFSCFIVVHKERKRQVFLRK